ncbi:MAG: LEA type 2 family protein [Myxococcales bacterium]|nr:LEA type 2 family protein [Myxococcales bacterium]
MAPRRRAPAALLLLALFVALTTACARKPTMKLREAHVSGVNVGFPPVVGVMLTSVVDVYNPNSYDVAIRAVRGEITLAGHHKMPVDYRAPGQGVWLPAGATTPVQVPVTVPVQVAFMVLREAAATPTIPFRLVGRADVTATRTFQIEKDDYEVDEEGSISRDQVAAVLGWRM